MSGGRRDASTLAIAHRQGDEALVALVRGWKAPHSPKAVVQEMALVLRS
jgi:hypothetical protein